MFTQPLSVLEISRIIEQAFLPTLCVCSSADSVMLRVQVSSPDDPERLHILTDIPLAELNSSRALSKLVLTLREQMLSGSKPSESLANWRVG
jgi:hypothetical protein